MRYVSLHHHSTFSYQDGYGLPAEHFARAAELEMSAMALTEHGNVSSHVGAEKASLKTGVKAIYGLEAYMHPLEGSDRKFHLTLLAMDEKGYENLNRIVTRSWRDNFYRWPTVDGAMLADHHEGLICLSGCSDSFLACTLLGGKDIPEEDASFKAAQRVALNFKALFGDRYYLEVQTFPELPRAHKIARAYERMVAKHPGLQLVATSDVHTLKPGQGEIRALLHAAGRGNNTIAKQMSGWEYDVPDYAPLSDQGVLRSLRAMGLSKASARRALHNTEEIAARCNLTLPKATRFAYPVEDPEAEMWNQLREGWRYRVRQGNSRMTRTDLMADYTQQISREMELIVSKGFVSYFLLVADLVRWAKEQGIAVGPGRGSSAASVVCYLLRITEPDPLQFPMTDFSRFVDPTRVDLPDIDVDFDDTRRHEVRAYAVRRYGEENVANIGTFTKYKGRNSLDDVGRVYSIPPGELAVVKGMIIERSGGDSRADASLVDTFSSFPAAGEVLARHPKLEQAIALEGNYKGMSTHAAGLVISSRPIAEVCATYTRDVKGHTLQAVSVNKYDAEYLGLMKIDVLGLTTMGALAEMMRDTGMTLEEMYALPLDDPETIAAFTRADVIGVFQYEGRATRLVCREVKPDSIFEAIDVNALSRPGPLFSGTTTEYIKIKRGQMEVPLIHPIIDRITRPTRGQIIYQEQILHALAEFGGLPVQRVHEIRRIISQKLGEAQFNTSMQNFVDNAIALHGVDASVAEKVWERVVTSASYAFVYSHALSYTIIGYWAMWFKVHHPSVFFKVQLSRCSDANRPTLVKDSERHGVRIKGVTLGLSRIGWHVAQEGLVVAGYDHLPGVGAATALKIVAEEERRGVPFSDPSELLDVSGIGPATLAKMRPHVNVDDPFGLARLQADMEAVRKFISETPGLPRPTHTSDTLLPEANTKTVFLGKVLERNYQDYVENKRARYGTDVAQILAEMKRPDLKTSVVLRCVDDGDEDVYVRINRFVFPKLKARIDGIRVGHDLILVRGAKNDAVAAFGISVQTDTLITIDPDD